MTKLDAAIEEAVKSTLETIGLEVIKSKPFFGMNSETLLHPCQEFWYNQQETKNEA